MKKVIILLFILLTSASWADDNKLLDVQIQINDKEGSISITHEIDGQQNTINETFKIKEISNVDKIIADIFKKHDLDIPKNLPPTSKLTSRKQLDKIDVEVINENAHITITKNKNGKVNEIKKQVKIEDDVELSELVEGAARKHIIEINPKTGQQVIQIDRNYFTDIDIEGAYFGFMASVEDKGWQVITVIPDSGADQAGLQEGDLIVAVDGKKTGDGGIELKNLTKQAKAGEKSTFKIIRAGKKKTLKITPQKRTLSDAVLPPLPPMPPSPEGEYEIITMAGAGSMTPHVMMRHQKLQEWLGTKHQLIAVNPGLESYFGTDKGVLIVNVDKDNKLALAEGDVILSINGEQVTTPKQAVKALLALKLTEGFNIEVMRKKEKISIAS